MQPVSNANRSTTIFHNNGCAAVGEASFFLCIEYYYGKIFCIWKAPGGVGWGGCRRYIIIPQRVKAGLNTAS